MPYQRLLCCSLLFLSACSASSHIRNYERNYEGSLQQYSARVYVIPSNAKVDDKVVRDVRAEIISRLIGGEVFREIAAPAQPADVDLSVSVTRSRNVSGAGRFWGGIMAGPNSVEGEVSLVHNQTGTKLCSFNLIGDSGAHPTGASDMDDAVRAFADSVVEYLVKPPPSD